MLKKQQKKIIARCRTAIKTRLFLNCVILTEKGMKKIIREELFNSLQAVFKNVENVLFQFFLKATG